MPVMEWDDSFVLGINNFDEHHKRLIALLNIAFDGFTRSAGRDELAVVLDELLKYAKYHFAAERHWMKLNEYPGLVQHCKEHGIFTNKVVAFQKDFQSRKTSLSLDVLQFLMSWLTNHILMTDGEYGRFALGVGHA
jgi:hemerythrin